MRSIALLLAVAACTSQAARGPAAPAARADPIADPARDEASPAPEWHEYPGLAADELSEPAPDAGVASECLAVNPPPLPSTRAERVYSGPPITNHIPPELVMRPIRLRAACFRACYAQGLRKEPKLAGRVSVRFVIDRDGWVRKAEVQDTDLADRELVACAVRHFVGLRYPEPDGRVTVVYPLRFEPE